MRRYTPLVLQANRIRKGDYASDESFGLAGAFKLLAPNGTLMLAISSGSDTESGWEHVSCSCEDRCPTWEEMCFVKDIFWMEDECVVQYHPPKSEYVNYHPHCLHMWKPINMSLPIPQTVLVGPKGGRRK
jgi:hypothetical protein